jgi:hypothetical protein
MPITVRYDDAKHKYWIDGEEVPSVTAILDATLPKPALTWWGFRVGMATTMELCKRGRVNWPTLTSLEFDRIKDNNPAEGEALFMPNDKDRKKPRTVLEHHAILQRLHPNAIKDDAADRGTSIHEALVALGLGDMPSLKDFPPEDRPFVQALCRWWLEHEPEFVLQEQIAASKTHMYAGRFDLMVKYPGDDRVVLADLKTGKDVRPDSHYRQLMGYKVAWDEMQLELDEAERITPERLQIINVRPTGDYVLGEGTGRVTPAIWLACVEQHRRVVEFEALQKAPNPLPLPKSDEHLADAA